MLKQDIFSEQCIKLQHKDVKKPNIVVCQEHAYFTASLCNAVLGNSWLTTLLASEAIYELWSSALSNVHAKLLTGISSGSAANSQWVQWRIKYESKKHFIKHLSFSYSLRLARIVDLCGDPQKEALYNRGHGLAPCTFGTTGRRPRPNQTSLVFEFAHRID